MELVRISTAGSVDDGKSTLIGRLLHDNQALTKEQEELIERKTAEKGWDDLDFSVITDGLVAEREQGITIDVAHIYFSTDTRKFIIADSPGHVEYTRNMVTGASNSEVSIILVDARKGLVEQSYRHFYISQLLKLDQVIFCVNKMDLVDYSEDQFLKIAVSIKEMVSGFGENINYEIIPISSLKGDNVVEKSANMPWFSGDTLNDVLHRPKVRHDKDVPFRFDVQQVYHVQNDDFVDFRGFAGRVLSGTVNVGDEIITLPSEKKSKITEIRRYTETQDSAREGESVIISLEDEIDISRGSILVKPDQTPNSERAIKAALVWMDDHSAVLGGKLLLKSGAREFPIKIAQILAKVDPISGAKEENAASINLNDISEVLIKMSQPAYLDSYAENPTNGSFILIDPQSNNTVAAGFVQ